MLDYSEKQDTTENITALHVPYVYLILLAGVKWVIRADKYGKIKFCGLQSKAAEPYLSLCGVDREDVLLRFIFVEGLEQYH